MNWINPRTDPPPSHLNVLVLSEVGPVVAYRTHNGDETIYVIAFTTLPLTKIKGWWPLPEEEKPKRKRTTKTKE